MSITSWRVCGGGLHTFCCCVVAGVGFTFFLFSLQLHIQAATRYTHTTISSSLTLVLVSPSALYSSRNQREVQAAVDTPIYHRSKSVISLGIGLTAGTCSKTTTTQTSAWHTTTTSSMASSTFFHKPELALRRALELQGINQNEAALSLLHEVLSSRRHRTWSPAFEQIMMAYLNLCLKLHKAREAKDGLHQYRNLSQSQAPGSLEKVIRYLMERAEFKCSQAKANADAEALASATTITSTDHHHGGTAADDGAGGDDGDDGAMIGLSPQAILLSTMSTDPAKNQRDATLLLPALKFLWEIYRAVLDILRSNSKLEHVYHAAAMGALNFCQTYKRRTEFRRLCDMLRMHLGNLQKYGAINISEDTTKPNNKVKYKRGTTNQFLLLDPSISSSLCVSSPDAFVVVSPLFFSCLL